MTLIVNFKSSSWYSGVSPDTLESSNKLLTFLFNRFNCESVHFFLDYPNEIEGIELLERSIKNDKIKEIISFGIIRTLINNRGDFSEYFEKLRSLTIKIEGYWNAQGKDYPAYIIINNSRLSKIYGSLTADIYANEEYYNLYELIQNKDKTFIDEFDGFIMSDSFKIKENLKSCFILNDDSEKDFPFNAAYLYYDSPLGYVNDGFIEVYKIEAQNRKHLTPIKTFLARKIATSEGFRKYLFEESKAVGLIAASGSLSIKVVKENALELIYKSIYDRIHSFIKTLPDEDFIQKEIEKRFKI